MVVKRSTSWDDTKDDLITEPSNEYADDELIDEDLPSQKDSIDKDDVYEKQPLINKNPFLDEDMYNKLKSADDKTSKLKVLSSTSEKEDFKFVVNSLIFVVSVILISLLEIIVDLLKGEDLGSWGAIRYVIAGVLAFIISKFISKKKN